MPTYEYRCKECEHELEVQQSFADDPLTECPSCNRPSLKKRFSAVGISFKGSGFYKTDSRGSSSSSSSSTTSSTAGSASDSSSASSDTSSTKESTTTTKDSGTTSTTAAASA